jgi:ABC-2 type transport system ATP-binding protein
MLKLGRVVALDTTRNLLAGVAGIHLKVRLEPDRLPATLEAQASRNPDGTRMIAIQRHADVADVIVAIRAAGVQVLELELVQPDLEEAFVKIVGRP